MALNSCIIRYNSGINYTKSFLPETTPNNVTISYTVTPTGRASLIKVFLEVADNSDFSNATSILANAYSNGQSYIVDTINDTCSLYSADLSSFYSNSERLYVRLAVYQTVYEQELESFTEPIVFERLDITHYYNDAEWKRAEMLVYNSNRGWLPGKIKT